MNAQEFLHLIPASEKRMIGGQLTLSARGVGMLYELVAEADPSKAVTASKLAAHVEDVAEKARGK